MKIKCVRCLKELDVSHFLPRADSKTGYRRECSFCVHEVRRKRREERKKREEKEKSRKIETRDIHRKKLLTAAGNKISNGDLIAETARSMTFNLALIVEYQLRMFYGRNIRSVLNRNRMNSILDDTLFEVKTALGRAGARMAPVIKHDKESSLDFHASVKDATKRLSARIILGVGETATLSEIKAAYRAKALEAHPDRCGTTEEMQRLNEAFAILEDSNG